ncbi:unnamed protein product [Rhizophagus irregularis]|nr:unnamed protein product [Rhizophagus irregularis]
MLITNKENPILKLVFLGVHVFCLNSQELERERERKRRSHMLKPFNKLSNSMKTKRVYMFNEQLAVNFTNTAAKYFHSDDCPTLQKICLYRSRQKLSS